MACSRPPGPMTSTFTVSKGTWCTPQAPKLCRPLDMLNFRGRALAGAGQSAGHAQSRARPLGTMPPCPRLGARAGHVPCCRRTCPCRNAKAGHVLLGPGNMLHPPSYGGTCPPRPRRTDLGTSPGTASGSAARHPRAPGNPRDMSSPGLGHWAQSHHAHVRVPGLDMSRGAGEHAHTRVPRLDMSVALGNMPMSRFQDWACPVDRGACPLPGAAGGHAHRPEDRTRRRTIRRARGYEWPV